MIKAILFDINGTLTDIYTSESDESIYRTTANFLDYHRVKISPETLKNDYFALLKEQKDSSSEKYPEFDVVELFAGIIKRYGDGKNPVSPEIVATIFRAAGRYRLQLYPDVIETLDVLKKHFRLSAVSDGQKLWAIPELKSVGLDKYLHPVVISSDYGFRKPDVRMYRMVLEKLNLPPQEAIFVGNDMFRDVYGAGLAGMKTVFFRSNQGDHSPHGVEADYIIYRFGELINAVEFLTGTHLR